MEICMPDDYFICKGKKLLRKYRQYRIRKMSKCVDYCLEVLYNRYVLKIIKGRGIGILG